MNKSILIFFLTLFISSSGFSQVTQVEKIQQAERERQMAQKAELMRLLEHGVQLMENGEHVDADKNFRQVLEAAKVVPTDLCFYFGKNSFYLGKFQQSIDWLNKYLELKGTDGRFYDECILYLQKSKEAFLTLREEERKEAEAILTSSYDIDCGPSGKVVCPVCKGKAVIITTGPFGDKNYKVCPYSNEHGYLTCDEYNKLLRGELEPRQ